MIDTGMSHIGFRCIVRTRGFPAGETFRKSARRPRTQATRNSHRTQVEDSMKAIFQTVSGSSEELLYTAQVPWHAKMVVGCAVLYVVSPIQLIPNFIPIIGQLDDVLVVTLSDQSS